MKKSILLFTAFLTIFLCHTYAQTKIISEKDKIKNILEVFIDCIETKDSVTMYNLFHKGEVTWIGVNKDATQKELSKKDSSLNNYEVSNYKTWFRRIATPPIRREDFKNIEIIEDGSVASVSFDYSFWANGRKNNWGKELWHLINENGEWKIVSVIFSKELERINPEFESPIYKNSEAAKLTKKMATELMSTTNLPGLSIAIRKNDEIIYAEGFGYADLEKKIPVTPNTQFRAASTSKAITVTGLAKMMQDSIININAEVQKYVPQYPLKKHPITLKQLAGNTSGMPHYLYNDKLENRYYSSINDALTVFSHHELLFKPDSKYNYSSAGFVLLSAAMEGASGINFLEYLQDNVFNPLGMKSTEPDRVNYKSMPNLTKFYKSLKDGYVSITNPRDVSSIWAAGGFVTTPSDLVNMTKAYSNGYLNNKIVDRMFESQTLLTGEKTNVGIGWRIGEDMEGRKIIEHAGVTEGTRTIISFFPDEDIAISVMTNTDWVSSIEETGHMLLLPFLTDKKTNSLLNGNYPINIVRTQNDKQKEYSGNIKFENGSGSLTIDGIDTYSIIHIDNNTYSLITNQGIYHLTIEVKNNKIVAGKSTMYKTPMSEKPINIKPFITFRSNN